MTPEPNRPDEREAARLIEGVRNMLHAHSRTLPDDWHDFMDEQVRALSNAIAALRRDAPREGGEAGMLPDELGPHAAEWYTLCERAPHAFKISISGQLASAIVATLCRLNSPADEAGVRVSAVPANCRERLRHEGKPYPRSSCDACGKFSPKSRECDILLDAAAIAQFRAASTQEGG